MTGHEALIKVDKLTKHYPIRRGILAQRQVGSIKAVEDLSFTVFKGETLGLVGESGCGKTTTGRTILQLERPSAGKVYYKDIELTSLSGKDLRQVRKNIQIIFQDPYASLDPRKTIGSIVAEPLTVHFNYSASERSDKVKDLMELVGLNPNFVNRYPHEFSGGQRQRVGIARAVGLEPEFIVCDEPISALDVSIQAQVVNLLDELQDKLGLTYLFIAHDLSMVQHISNRTAVMYLGRIVELSPSENLFTNPLHPYSQALLSAVPIPDPPRERERKRIILTGDVPSPANPPSGCNFHTRCLYAKDICQTSVPEWREYVPDHWVACHLVGEIQETMQPKG